MQEYTIMAQGKVQGVFYRSETVQMAKRLALTGWVKNQSSGSVKIIVQGSSKNLEKFTHWCSIGPPLAKVTKIKVKCDKAVKEFKDFIIKY